VNNNEGKREPRKYRPYKVLPEWVIYKKKGHSTGPLVGGTGATKKN
jgi:hypothetical protein